MMLHDGNSPIDRLYRIVENIVQQTTYQWFGNVVSPSWWTSIWLNDGLAEYFSYYFADKVENEIIFIPQLCDFISQMKLLI